MSAIAGIIDLSGAPVAPTDLDLLLNALDHRGGDGAGRHASDGEALGHLSRITTAESAREHQPVVHPHTGCALVLDGYLSNWQELRQTLKRPDAGDAELALAAHDTWGNDFARHLQGEFALAVWEPRTRQLLCARDIAGLRPFYYHWNGVRFAFASELRALLGLPGVTRSLDPAMVREWTEYAWQSNERTFWTGIRRLPPAQLLTLTGSGPHTRPYWSPPLGEPIHHASDSERADHLRVILEEAVRCASRSIAPIGVEVSGGLDSSAVLALADLLHRTARLPAPGLRGYTLAFPTGSAAYELPFARAVAAHTGRPVAECEPTLPAFDWYQREATRTLDFPGFPNSAMSLGLRRQCVEDGCRVLLNGQGGDEWLGAWLRGIHYADLIRDMDWRGLFTAMIDDRATIGLRATMHRLLRRGLKPLLRPTTGQRRFREHRPSHRVQLERLEDAFTLHANEIEERLHARDGLDRRSPLLARPVIEFAFRTAEAARVRGHLNKAVHRTAMRGLLPECVRLRTDKATFSDAFRPVLGAAAELVGAAAKEGPEKRKVAQLSRAALLLTQGRPMYVLWSTAMCVLLEQSVVGHSHA